MRTTRIQIVNRQLIINNKIIYTGKNNVDNFKFLFDDEWTELDKTLVIIVDKKTYNVALINDEAILPSGVYSDNQSITVGVFGKKGDTILSSNLIKIVMTQGAYLEGQAPDNLITPTQWDLYVEEINRLLSEAKASEEECQKALEEVRLIKQKLEKAEFDIDEYNSNHDEKMKAYNSNSEQKTTEYNNNATQKTNAFNENYTEKFNSINTAEDTALDNISTETAKFNKNAEEKLNSFNSNSTNKVNEFDENVTSKTTAFDTNATNKTDEFNSNYEEKLGLFNEDANVQRISNLENEAKVINQDLDSIFGDSEEMIGETLTLENSADKVRFKKFSIQGASEQSTRSGKNFIDLPEVYSLTGVVNALPISLEPGEYTVSCKSVVSDGSATRFLIYLRFEDDTSLSVYTYFDTLKTTFSIAKKTVNFNLYSQDLYASSQGVTTVFTGLQIEKGPVATDYEKHGASPTPEYPSEIKNITSINGKIVGKNLASNNYEDYTMNDTSYAVYPINLKKGKTYTLSATLKGEQKSNYYNYGIVKDGDTYRTFVDLRTVVEYTSGITRTYSFTVDDSYVNPKLVCYIQDNTQTKFEELFSNYEIQLKEGISTEFEPYQEQIFTFPLADGQKMYQDSYLADDGIHYKRKQHVFTGEENWVFRNLNSDSGIASYSLGNVLNEYKHVRNIIGLSNYYGYLGTVTTLPAMYDLQEGFAFYYNSTVPTPATSIYINSTEATLEAFKTFLKTKYENGTPLKVEYELNEEEIIPYTAEQKQAYNSLKQLYTYKGITYVFFTNDFSPKSDVIYRKDVENILELKNEIGQLNQELNSLQQDMNGVAVNSEELIEESLTVNDSADKVRFKKFSIKGNSVQSEVPTSQTLSEIKNVTSVNGKIVGKNWFDKNNYNLINAYIVVDSPEIILPNDGGTQNQCIYINCKPNTRYTISKKIGQRFGAAYSIDIPAPGIAVYGCRTNPTASTLTILTGETAKYLIVYIRNGNNQNELTLQEVLDSLQIEENSKATPYEAYQEQTFAFPLLDGQKLYADSYLADDGIHHKRGTIIYNGSEEWTTASSLYNDESCWFTVAKPSNMLIALLANGEIMSDHFKNYNCYAATNLEDGICTHASGGVMVRIKKSNLTDTTATAFKAWLSEHNVTVEYPLAEEEVIPYTTEQKQAYDLLKKLYTFKGTTHVFFEDEVSPKADLIYRKDIETLINNLATAIVAIGGEE